MKHSLILLSICLLLFTGCKKEQVIIPNRTILTSVNSGSWISLNGGKRYTAAINMPEIDTYFNEHGAVLVYISFGGNVYEQVPQVYDGISYSYTTRPGQIVMEIQSSDGLTAVTPPGTIRLKIVLIESL